MMNKKRGPDKYYTNQIAKLTRTIGAGEIRGIKITSYILFFAYLLLFIAIIWLIIKYPPKILP
jgi:hypothetical protein